MNQLVKPDLTVTGSVGWCLQYAAKVFHCIGVAPYAWTAWQQTAYKHVDAIPTDVSVPCWFSFYSEGINMGHVVVSVPGRGFYSSPYKNGSTFAILPSIAEVERIYGAKYVGWSEDILGLKVVEGGNNDMFEGKTAAEWAAIAKDSDQWKPAAMTLSFDPAYPAMGGAVGMPLIDTSGITRVMDDFRANKAANEDAQPYKQFVAVDNADVWQSVGGDLTQLKVVKKDGTGPKGVLLKPGEYYVQ